MARDAFVDRLVDRIYDCTIDSSNWPIVLQECCRFVGGVSANLFTQYADGEIGHAYTFNENVQYTRSYRDTYRFINPLFPDMTLLRSGQVVTVGDLMPWDSFSITPFFQEWVAPQQLSDIVAANVGRVQGASTLISIRRGHRDEPAGAQQVRRLARLVPHLQRTISVERAMQQHQAAGLALEGVLEAMPQAAFLLDAELRVLFANVAGEASLSSRRVVRLFRGSLGFCQSGPDEALKASVAAAVDSIPFAPIAPIVVDDTIWLSQVLQLASGARAEAAYKRNAVALLLIRTAGFDARPSLLALGQAYGLTPAEVRVFATALEFESSESVAQKLGVSVSTVKTHLRALYAKVGVHRQAALLKVLIKFRTSVG